MKHYRRCNDYVGKSAKLIDEIINEYEDYPFPNDDESVTMKQKNNFCFPVIMLIEQKLQIHR